MPRKGKGYALKVGSRSWTVAADIAGPALKITVTDAGNQQTTFAVPLREREDFLDFLNARFDAALAVYTRTRPELPEPTPR